jgi:hypothetical protein
MRADAYKQFNEAAIIQTVLAALPDIVRAAAEPMKHIDSLTVMSSDGASEVVRNATRVVTESGTVIKGLTGIDVPTLIGGAMRSGGFTTKANGGGGDGDGSEPAKAPPAPPPAQTPRPPAGMPPQSASAETEPAEPLDPVERSAAQLAANLRAVPEIQRYGHLSLRDIPAGAPRPMKLLWAAAEKELGNRYGDVTVRELLDRFAGTSLH